MAGPYIIDLEAWFDENALCKTLGLRAASLDRGRRTGELRYTRKGGRILYLGRWVHEWLTREEAAAPAEASCA